MQLELLPYLVEVAARLKTSEPEIWASFQSETSRQNAESEMRHAGTRLDRCGPNERSYVLAVQARNALGLAAPVTLYQRCETKDVPDAALLFLPREIVITCEGRLLDLIDKDAGLLAHFGRAMARHQLFSIENGRFNTAEHLLQWVIQHDACPPEFIETARRYRLNTEVYCDRGGLIACGDQDAAIRALTRIVAGFRDAGVAAHLEQSKKLISKGGDAPRGSALPDWHIRVLAIANAETMETETFHTHLDAWIAGKMDLGRLDLRDQARLRELTRSMLDRLVIITREPVGNAIAYARRMFPDFTPPLMDVGALPRAASHFAPASVEYLAYVLLDFATLDATDRTAPMVAAAAVADEIGIGARFREIARHELKCRRAMLSSLVQRAA